MRPIGKHEHLLHVRPRIAPGCCVLALPSHTQTEGPGGILLPPNPAPLRVQGSVHKPDSFHVQSMEMPGRSDEGAGEGRTDLANFSPSSLHLAAPICHGGAGQAAGLMQ